MAKTNGRTKNQKVELPCQIFLLIFCGFGAYPFRYFSEAKFTGVVMMSFLIIPAINLAYLAASIPSYW